MRRDFNAEHETVSNVASKIMTPFMSLFGLIAHADENNGGEGGETHVEPSTSGTVNYEDLIAKARKEEKEKQYKTIEKLKADLKTMTANNNGNLIRIGELESQVEELNKKLTASNSGDSEAVATLKADLAKLQKELSDTKAELEKAKASSVDESALRKQIEEEIKAEYEVKNYRLELLSKNSDVLVPELIMGTTKDELDASLAQAKARSEEIRKQFNPNPNPQPMDTNAFANRMPAIGNPSASSASASVSFEDLARLDPASPEYAEMRRKLGLR